MGYESFALSCWGWHWGKWNPRASSSKRYPHHTCRRGVEEANLILVFPFHTKCMAVPKLCKARKHNSLEPGGEESSSPLSGPAVTAAWPTAHALGFRRRRSPRRTWAPLNNTCFLPCTPSGAALLPQGRFMRCLAAGDSDTDLPCLGRKGRKRVHFQHNSCHSGTWIYPALE